jgi:hypothetical protein
MADEPEVVPWLCASDEFERESARADAAAAAEWPRLLPSAGSATTPRPVMLAPGVWLRSSDRLPAGGDRRRSCSEPSVELRCGAAGRGAAGAGAGSVSAGRGERTSGTGDGSGGESGAWS